MQENLENLPIRPLPFLSDFVAQGLHNAVNTNPKQFRKSVQEIVKLITKSDIELALSVNPRLSRLDAKMMEATFIHNELKAPKSLTKLVDKLSGLEMPVILYEEIIMANPVNDTRTFTSGAIRQTEQMFYMTHKLVEKSLDKAVAKVRNALAGQYEQLANIEEDMKPLIFGINQLREAMDTDHFNIFRPYFNSHPIRNLNGPSAKFTGNIPLLDTLIRKSISKKIKHGYAANCPYVQSPHRDLIKNQTESENAVTLEGLLETDPNNELLRHGYKVITEYLELFRARHISTVHKHLPEALKGTPGSGGESDVKDYLLTRIREFKTKKPGG